MNAPSPTAPAAPPPASAGAASATGRPARRPRSPGLRRLSDRGFHVLCVFIASVAIAVLAILLGAIFIKGIGHFRVADDAGVLHFSWAKVGRFLSSFASADAAAAGIKAPLAGSALVCLLCMLFAVPIGVATAVLLEEFRPRSRRWMQVAHGLVQTNITNLAGVPSIVYGILGVTVFATFFGLIPKGSELEVGSRWFDQYTLPDGRVVFTRADGPAPHGAAALAAATLAECAADRASGDADAAALAKSAEEELLGRPRLTAALAAAPEELPAEARTLVADSLAKPPAAADSVRAFAALDRDLARLAGRLHDQLAVERDHDAHEKLEHAESAVFALRNAQLDDLGAAHARAFGAHPARAYLSPRPRQDAQGHPLNTEGRPLAEAGGTPAHETHWLGGEIGYDRGDPAQVVFLTSAERAARDARETAIGEMAAGVVRAVDALRSGSRRTGPVALGAADAARIAAEADAKVTLPGAVRARLEAQLLALDGLQGGDMRSARGKMVDELAAALRPAAAGATPLAVGAPAVRIKRTLWWHASLPFGRGVLAGALTLMLVVLPIVIVATQEALRSVPQTLRQAAAGLGATPWQVVARCTLPAAVPGICTGVILAFARALGEAAPILILGGVVFITFLPGNLMSDFTVMPLQIFDWTGLPQEEFRQLAAAGIIVLLALLIVFNGAAALIRQKSAKSM